ncbi:MAG: hypothetical protein M1835_000829 [Candelina submexicana]|nr:MAG: hypothetical protein M1835_000829 [Candelina submexicana]
MIEPDATQSRLSVFKSSSTLGESFVHSVREWRSHEKAPRDDVATDSSILSIFPGVQQGRIQPTQLLFYRWWLDKRLGDLPATFLTILPGTVQILDLDASSPLTEIFLSIAGYIKTKCEPAIDNIIEHLRKVGLLRLSSTSEGSSKEEAQRLCRSLVFAILGWQTMLYQASFGTSPPQQLAIVDDQDGYKGQAFMKLKQDQNCAKRQLKTFLMGFGLFLAPRNQCVSDFPEECQAFESVTVIDSEELNFFLLQSIADVNIKWIDVLAPHMEYDKSTNTLFLFRYPSFCAANLPSQAEEAVSLGVIHRLVFKCSIIINSKITNSCATQGDDSTWASEGETTDFLREVMLSYRLIFGQSKEARHLFRTMDPFEDVASEGRDGLLLTLCGRKSMDTSAFGKERSAYHLPQHFPILRFRLAVLRRQLSFTKARGWKELWRDRRDSANWYTFWAVLIIGGIGILLSFLQVTVGIVQVVMSTRPNKSS